MPPKVVQYHGAELYPKLLEAVESLAQDEHRLTFEFGKVVHNRNRWMDEWKAIQR